MGVVQHAANPRREVLTLTISTRKRTTPAASNLKKTPKTRHQTPPTSPKPTGWDSLSTAKPWLTTGICFHCRRAIESQQPGGLNPRHVHNQIPLCSSKQLPS